MEVQIQICHKLLICYESMFVVMFIGNVYIVKGIIINKVFTNKRAYLLNTNRSVLYFLFCNHYV